MSFFHVKKGGRCFSFHPQQLFTPSCSILLLEETFAGERHWISALMLLLRQSDNSSVVGWHEKWVFLPVPNLWCQKTVCAKYVITDIILNGGNIYNKMKTDAVWNSLKKVSPVLVDSLFSCGRKCSRTNLVVMSLIWELWLPFPFKTKDAAVVQELIGESEKKMIAVLYYSATDVRMTWIAFLLSIQRLYLKLKDVMTVWWLTVALSQGLLWLYVGFSAFSNAKLYMVD